MESYLRSRSILRNASARFFVDPSIGTSVLNISSSRLLADYNSFGLFFEALVVRDLRIYTDSLRGGCLQV